MEVSGLTPEQVGLVVNMTISFKLHEQCNLSELSSLSTDYVKGTTRVSSMKRLSSRRI